jgi:hypothetical protein
MKRLWEDDSLRARPRSTTKSNYNQKQSIKNNRDTRKEYEDTSTINRYTNKRHAINRPPNERTVKNLSNNNEKTLGRRLAKGTTSEHQKIELQPKQSMKNNRDTRKEYDDTSKKRRGAGAQRWIMASSHH